MIKLEITSYGTKLNGKLGCIGVLVAEYATSVEVCKLLSNLSVRDVHKIKIIGGDDERLRTRCLDMTLPTNCNLS